MKQGLMGLWICCVVIVLQAALAQDPTPAESRIIIVSSSAFIEGTLIPSKYTCEGVDMNPPISLADVPPEAKSLVLILDDPDAPMGTWSHWLMWNIDPKMVEIKEGEIPLNSVTGTNDFGKTRYNGPCPPSGVHRYFFRVYALDEKMELKAETKRTDLDKAMQGHIIAQGVLTGKYSR